MWRRVLCGIAVLGAIVWSATRAPLSPRASEHDTRLHDTRLHNTSALQISAKAAQNSLWTTIAPGVGWRSFSTRLSTSDLPVSVSALRVRPSRVHISGGALQNSDAWRRKYAAIAAVNGGYFDAENKPLGLRISDNKRTRDLRSADWGVFLIEGDTARIVHTRDYRKLRERGRTHRVLEAIQCGPRLIVDGKATQLKQQWARRTALGIDRSGYVVVAIADGQLSFAAWQRVWRDSFSCPNALNLDGGGSTQLSVRAKKFSREIGGYWPVPDAIVIR